MSTIALVVALVLTAYCSVLSARINDLKDDLELQKTYGELRDKGLTDEIRKTKETDQRLSHSED